MTSGRLSGLPLLKKKGLVVAYMGDCKSDSDCHDLYKMYCDQSQSKC